jgi:hypothetical protein
MLNVLKYVLVIAFIKCNKTAITRIFFLCLFLIVFLLIMSDIKSHVSGNGVVAFLMAKWLILFSVIFMMLRLLSKVFRIGRSDKGITDQTSQKIEASGLKKIAASNPKLQTRGDAIKDKYRKRKNGKD